MKLLCTIFAVFTTLSTLAIQSTESANCKNVLQALLKKPPPNTEIAINSRRLMARYSCRKGFRLVGEKYRTCKNGRWMNKEEPKCIGRQCGKPIAISNATFNGSSFGYKDPPLKYSCEKGYTLNGPRQRICRRNGRWSKGPTCSVTRCKAPKRLAIQNGNVTTTDSEYRVGATLAFECNPGYEINDNWPDTITCLDIRRWNGRFPFCEERKCPDPGRPENGDRYHGYFKIGDRVQFYCHSGFELHGSRERTCLENKEWSGSLTTCQDGSTDCPVLGTPINGRKYGRRYNYGDEVSFECNEGFVLKGSAIRKCTINGTWNGTEAICKDEFEDRFQDVNTTAFNLRKNVIDNLLEYACNKENETGCNEESFSGMDTRGRFINLNDKGGLELVFVLDASSSVKMAGFHLGKNFTKELVKTIGASPRAGGTRVALVTFGTEASLEFNLGDAKTRTENGTLAAIDEVRYRGGGTATAMALKMVDENVAPSARKDSHKVIMFITDGMSNIGGSPLGIAKKLRDRKKFTIYTIAIGRKIKHRELYDIASHGEEHIIYVKSYEKLQKAIQKAAHTKIDYSSCGESPVDFRARIVGGSTSKKGWWPWQVALKKPSINGGDQLFCGGALISPRWVLTAAHCFYTPDGIFNGDVYKIFAGVHRLDKEEKSEQDILPEKLEIHENYNAKAKTFLNDIALIKLQHEVELKKFVRTLCLPSKEEEDDLAVAGKYGYVSGWGVTRALEMGEETEKGDYSNELKYASYQIQRNALCKNSTTYTFESDAMFCGGDGKGGNDTCSGDSGGVFVREGKRGNGYRWIATGIVSWGEGCAQENKYGYYTRVYSYIDWINKIMTEN